MSDVESIFKNKKPEQPKLKKYAVVEIFGPTIQGEGLYHGSVCFFIRFAGCNKNCVFCDTEWRYGNAVTGQDIAKALDTSYNFEKLVSPIIVFSGGEPFLQLDNDIMTFILALNQSTVFHVETNGSINIDQRFDEGHFEQITMSPKQSLQDTCLLNPDAIKLLYPYLNESGEVWAENYGLYSEGIYIQPIWNNNYNRNVKDAIQEVFRLNNLGINAKLSVQTHKHIGVR